MEPHLNLGSYWNTVIAFMCFVVMVCVLLYCCFDGRQVNAQETDTSNIVDISSDNDIVKGINTLGFKLYNKLPHKFDNTLISPYSISIAFSMLDNASDNATKDQIENVLGITDLDSWNRQIHDLFSYEHTMSNINQGCDKYPKLITSNSLWMDDDMMLSEDADKDVINVIKDNYNGDIFTEDFSDSHTADKVDGWIDKNTNGLIKNLGADISDLDSLLVNTIYFKGSWLTQFDEANTSEKDFRTVSGVSKAMSMSIFDESFNYIEKDGLEAISIPYQGCYLPDRDERIDFDMVIIKSSDDDDLTTNKFDVLSLNEKLAFLSDIKESTEFKTVQIPKFKYEYTYDEIMNDLMNLGITDVFDSNRSDLSKLCDGLYVSDVKHKAVISVDEYGTEAAAMTALMMKCMAIIPEESSTKEFIVDKPFTYVIRNSNTGLIYFIGTVNSL